MDHLNLIQTGNTFLRGFGLLHYQWPRVCEKTTRLEYCDAAASSHNSKLPPRPLRRRRRRQPLDAVVDRGPRRGRATDPADGNDVIINLLKLSPATEVLTKSYIETRNRIELERLLSSFGIDVQIGTGETHLTVRKSLTKEQRELLRSLGYKK